MLRLFIRLLGPALLGVALAAAPAPAGAQDQQPTELQPRRVPGWTFTPGVVVGGLHDTNVTLLATLPTQNSASDNLFELEPFGQIEFYGPRTTLSGGYQGSMQRYFEFNELDAVEHRAFLQMRTRATRRLTVFLNENFSQVPSTDQLELNGVPFVRSAARYNSASGGIEARLSRTNDFSTRYEMTWVDFLRDDTLLTGGIVHGVRSSLTHRFTDRAALGGEYEFRWASLNQGTREQLFQDAGLVFHYRVGEATSFEAAGGLAHLSDRLTGLTRTGPYVRAELVHRMARATIGGEFNRSYVPSVAFGGTNQTERARAYIMMPLSRNRLYIQESVAWHHTDPFDPRVLPLYSAWLDTVVGYAVQRWVRVEGYHEFTHQDTRQPGGLINRQVAGVRFVISQPVRIQ